MKIVFELQLPDLPWPRRTAVPTTMPGPAGPMGPMGARGAPGRLSAEERERLSESWEKNAAYLDEVWNFLNKLDLYQEVQRNLIKTINTILTNDGHDLYPRYEKEESDASDD